MWPTPQSQLASGASPPRCVHGRFFYVIGTLHIVMLCIVLILRWVGSICSPKMPCIHLVQFQERNHFVQLECSSEWSGLINLMHTRFQLLILPLLLCTILCSVSIKHSACQRSVCMFINLFIFGYSQVFPHRLLIGERSERTAGMIFLIYMYVCMYPMMCFSSRTACTVLKHNWPCLVCSPLMHSIQLVSTQLCVEEYEDSRCT